MKNRDKYDNVKFSKKFKIVSIYDLIFLGRLKYSKEFLFSSGVGRSDEG